LGHHVRYRTDRVAGLGYFAIKERLVRLRNGAAQTVIFAAEPDYRVGGKAKINDGVLVHNS